MLNFITSKPDDYNGDPQLAVRESGLSSPPLPPVDPNDRNALPAGGGQYAVPAHLYTTGLVNQPYRSYYHLYDQALKHSRQNAVACRNDPVIFQAIREAQTPISQLSWVVEPADETNPAEVEAARKVTAAIHKTPRLQQMFLQLLEGLWYGRAGIQLTYQWDANDQSLMTVKDWLPLASDSLIARWSGDWGVLVNAAFEGVTENWNLGRAHFFDQKEAEAILIHQNEKEPADWYDTTGAGSIAGVGWRSRVYWYWFVRSNILANLLDLVERIGNGVWLAGFDQSNPEGRSSWERAIAEFRDRRVLMRPIDREGNSAYDLQILEPGTSATANLEGAIRYFDGIIRSVILGHPLGAGAEINIGGDPAAIYGDAITRSTKYHATNLAETLTSKWLPILYRYMAPGVAAGNFRFLTDHPNADELIGFAERLAQMGFQVDLDSLASVAGLSKAQPSSQVYSKVQSLNPVSVENGPPMGVPVAGNSPPVQQPVQQTQPAPAPQQTVATSS